MCQCLSHGSHAQYPLWTGMTNLSFPQTLPAYSPHFSVNWQFSLSGMFVIETARETDGLGVSSTKLRNMYMINPQVILDSDALEIVELFDKIKNRNVMDIEDELKDSDREIFDRKVLQAVGHEEIYDALKESLLLYTRYD